MVAQQQQQPGSAQQPDVLQLIGAHERSDESGSDSDGEELGETDPEPGLDGPVTPQPSARAAVRRQARQRRRQRRQQSVDLADAMAHARWVAAGSHDYGRMTIRELQAHARARFGPQWWQELETRGSRRTALVNLLSATD